MAPPEGQIGLTAPPRIRRQTIRVLTPCLDCVHSGLCAIEEQIEENLVLEIVEIGRPVRVGISCSEYEESKEPLGRRIVWTEERRAKFSATMAAKRPR